MNVISICVVVFLWIAPECARSQELLEDVDPAREQALQEYNAAFLKDQTYFAARYRIVKVNVDALFQERNIAITPFSDMKPIGLVFDRLSRETFWHGFYENDPIYAVTGNRLLSFTISMVAYGVDESGAAVRVAQDQGSFFAVSAIFDVLGDSKYVLRPLKFSPKYSVIYEIRRDAVIPVRIDTTPGDHPLSDEEQAVFDEYLEFAEALPDDTNKKVLGDVW